MKFVFNYKPEAKQRPRFGAKGKVHNPQKTQSLAYKWEAAAQKRSQSPEIGLESPICFSMRVYVPMPKSWSQKRKKELLGTPVTSKPDIDNYIKWYMDVLNGIAYKDDRYVSQGYFEKVWDYEGRVEIGIIPHNMSLLDEIEMLGSAAVNFHQGLCEIYEVAVKYEKNFDAHETAYLASTIQDICLDAGLHEIYGEKCS